MIKLREFLLECKQCLMATVFVILLVSLTGVSWWFVLVGSDPFHNIQDAHLFDEQDRIESTFRPGQWVYVKRFMCVDTDILGIQSHSLYSVQHNAAITLDFSSSVIAKGCKIRGWAFQVPVGIPAGTYSFRTVSRYQNNLIGRDQSTVFPAIDLHIVNP